MNVYTFQTVKLTLETWNLIAALMNKKNIPMSDALELLVRHGSIHLAKTEESWPLQ